MRTTAGMTQAELADALGVSQACISKIEHGEISGIDIVRLRRRTRRKHRRGRPSRRPKLESSLTDAAWKPCPRGQSRSVRQAGQGNGVRTQSRLTAPISRPARSVNYGLYPRLPRTYASLQSRMTPCYDSPDPKAPPHVCSMFARISRYYLTVPGISRQRNRRSRGQNGTARHYPALNPRVRGSSPWRRTRSDLGLCSVSASAVILCGAGLRSSWGRCSRSSLECACGMGGPGSRRSPLPRRGRGGRTGGMHLSSVSLSSFGWSGRGP